MLIGVLLPLNWETTRKYSNYFLYEIAIQPTMTQIYSVYDGETQQVLTSEEMEWENVLHFCF